MPRNLACLILEVIAQSGVLFIGACTPVGSRVPGALSPAAESAAVSDLAVFMAVVRAQESYPRSPVKVDPRPLSPDPLLWDVDAGVLIADGGAVERARTAALIHAGFALTDALQDRECGALAIPPAINTNQACPREGGYYSLILSLSRPPESDVPVPESCNGRAVVMRLINRSIAPEGTSRSVWDYVLCRTIPRGSWTVVERINLYNE